MILRLILIVAFMVFILPLSHKNKNRAISFDKWKHNKKELKQKILKKHGLK